MLTETQFWRKTCRANSLRSTQRILSAAGFRVPGGAGLGADAALVSTPRFV